MTTSPSDDHKPARTRRGKRGGSKAGPSTSAPNRCLREGCRGLVRRGSQFNYCSFVCAAIAKELDRAQRVCRALGTDNPMTSELWAETVALSDGWTRHIELDRSLYRAARSVGFTDEQWQAIQNGTVSCPSPPAST